ncbi:pimeloyl-ACP methyl ester carboxylesterase [Frondihabitans sp. PhB188]|uniref:alpha/beta fold hydrolase n=1 Tax=Frondihabitans sp. PhB188 TaxID=2485200 RepID=UPI000FA2728C|nr:alpha/beta hydrolase [Frondihabitans sp. PhB188]ROQ37319.1 pimeloyl-ACP methyl ester carboxylesterase [Frondihabitans sp. PhB188]
MGTSAAGDPIARRLVLLCHPTPGAGGFDPDPRITGPWGVHLLTLDRPGYGVSEPVTDPADASIARWADDLDEYVSSAEQMAEETQRVDFGAVGLVGWGSGGATALAFAARHPDRVDRVTIVGTAAPKRRSPVDKSAEIAEFARVKTNASVAEVAAGLEQTPFATFAALGIADDDPTMARLPELDAMGLRSRLGRMLDESAVQGATGYATDLLSLADGSWADDLGSITASVQLVYGDSDPAADVSDGHWFADRIPDATVVSVQGAGRLAIVDEWARILKHVAPQHGAIGEDVAEGR